MILEHSLRLRPAYNFLKIWMLLVAGVRLLRVLLVNVGRLQLVIVADVLVGPQADLAVRSQFFEVVLGVACGGSHGHDDLFASVRAVGGFQKSAIFAVLPINIIDSLCFFFDFPTIFFTATFIVRLLTADTCLLQSITLFISISLLTLNSPSLLISLLLLPLPQPQLSIHKPGFDALFLQSEVADVVAVDVHALGVLGEGAGGDGVAARARFLEATSPLSCFLQVACVVYVLEWVF